MKRFFKFSPWPGIIILGYLVFMIFTIASVIFSFFHTTSLVEKDYYSKGLAYQNRLDRAERTARLRHSLQWKYNSQLNLISFYYPDTISPITGTIYFYRPADAGMDSIFPISVDSTGMQQINLKNFARGLWKIKISWQAGDLKYYTDGILDL